MESPRNNKVQTILKSGFSWKLKSNTKVQHGGLHTWLFFNQNILCSCICSTFSTLPARGPTFGTVLDCLCLAFAEIAHILNTVHLQFLKIFSYSSLFEFFISQPAKSTQALTVLMTAVSSHFLDHNIKKTQQNSYRPYLTS